jgi:hypothetical protein
VLALRASLTVLLLASCSQLGMGFTKIGDLLANPQRYSEAPMVGPAEAHVKGVLDTAPTIGGQHVGLHLARLDRSRDRLAPVPAKKKFENYFLNPN